MIFMSGRPLAEYRVPDQDGELPFSVTRRAETDTRQTKEAPDQYGDGTPAFKLISVKSFSSKENEYGALIHDV